jgi:hypothetical protein
VRLLTETSKLTGTPGESGWAQVHEFTPPEPEGEKLRGHLVAVIATKKENAETISSGREIISRLQEEYFGKGDGSIFNCLKSALEKIRQERADVEIIAAVVAQNVVYAAVGGGGKVAILRDGMLASILEGKEGAVASASGYPKDGDTLVLGTSSFFSTISPGVIKAELTAGPQAAVESFASVVHANNQSGNIGLAVVSFKEEGPLENVFKENSPGKFPTLPPFAGFKMPSFFERLIKKLPERRIYIQLPQTGEGEILDAKKRTFTIGIILLILLAVSIGFGIKVKRDRDSRGRYGAKLTEAGHQLSEAESLYSLNPDRARELLAQSRDTVNELVAQKVSDPELTSLREKLAQDEGKILGEYKEEPESFLDLSLLSSGFSGDKVFSSADKIFVLDKNGKKIVNVAYATKRSEVVAGPDDLGNVQDATVYDDRVFALNDTGVYEVTVNKRKVIEKEWDGEVKIYAYTGNMYVLDKGANMVWRYQGTAEGGGFGAKQKWFGPGVSPDFSEVLSWTIDGSVWTLDSTARILRFTLGKQDAFSLSGVAPALNSATAFYTNEGLKSIYILDSHNSRVLVVSKEGKFVAQYLADQLKEAKGLAVSEDQKKIIVLLGNKLYSMELKHL